MAHIEHEDAVDPVDRLVLGDDQPTDIPLKLREGVGRKHRREKRGVVTHDFRNFDHRQHKNTSRGRTRPFRGGILLRFFSRKRNKSSRSCCKSRVLTPQFSTSGSIRNWPTGIFGRLTTLLSRRTLLKTA